MAPQITALYAGLLALIMIVLAYRVSMLRKKHHIGIGGGNEPALDAAVRCHGNATEYVPIAVVLLLTAELLQANAVLLHSAGIVFVLGRILHARGLTQSVGESFGRFWGTAATWLVILVLAITNIILALCQYF